VHAPAVCRLSRCASAITGGDELGGLTRVKPFKYSYEKVCAEAVCAQLEKVRACLLPIASYARTRRFVYVGLQPRTSVCLPAPNCITRTHVTPRVARVLCHECCVTHVTPRVSPLVCHPSCVTPRVSPLVCHPSCVTPRVSLLVCHPSCVTPRVSPLVCHPSCVTSRVSTLVCHPSCVTPRVSPLVCHPSCVTPRVSPLVCHARHPLSGASVRL